MAWRRWEDEAAPRAPPNPTARSARGAAPRARDSTPNAKHGAQFQENLYKKTNITLPHPKKSIVFNRNERKNWMRNLGQRGERERGRNNVWRNGWASADRETMDERDARAGRESSVY
ncbi:hypothetical protein niasHT_003055 [Heterodera trifolii]|uniref:Uncharacterized protein n=1 Tax=Heterodera trifolii TaxID=157864 RepID=A0ABD2M4W7_9BILA